MKEEILNLLNKLSNGEIDSQLALDNLLELFHKNENWISVSDEEPPSSVELLVKSPKGYIYICNWRPAYNIFTVQSKSESSYDWFWKLL